MQFNDRLENLVAGLGTDRDKSSHTYYVHTPIPNATLAAMYRDSWLARKIVNIPAEDSTSKWRGWFGSRGQIEKLEAEEKRLGVRDKVLHARILARLYGGAGIYISVKGDEARLADPIDPARVSKQGIAYLLVLGRGEITAGERSRDPLTEGYNMPLWYTLPNSQQQIHPSRIVRFVGASLPRTNDGLMETRQVGWGDSVLQAMRAAIEQSDNTNANIASLVFEANVDVYSVPDFMDKVGDKEYRDRLVERMRLAAVSKGINGMAVMDALEKLERKSASFAQLPELMDKFGQFVSGASGIPMSRLMEQTAKGLNNNGDGDSKNYYDRIKGEQELQMSPAMHVLDECIIYSALARRPKNVYYEWRSLWQPTAKEKGEVVKVTAETIKILGEAKVFAPEVLSEAALTMMIESGGAPGLEAAALKYANSVTPDPTGDDEEPVPIYVSRMVTNVAELRKWAEGQGLKLHDSPHVTITYSRDPVDWMAMGDSYLGALEVPAGGARMMDKFGDALVLLFNSSELSWRNREMRERGASWDYQDYQPHITIDYDAATLDPTTIQPYRGKILLGPEIFEEIKEDYAK